MEALGYVIGIALCIGIYRFFAWWQNRPEYIEREKEKQLKQAIAAQQLAKQRQDVMEQTKGTRDLFMETLTKIGCQYELAEEENDDRIFFAYQGEHFFVNASNDWQYIQIFDTHWGHVELYDVDEFSRLRKAVNNANINCATMTVYTINEEAKTVDVHCKSTFPFMNQMPELENYLRSVLSDFFTAHRFIGNEMAKLREQDQADKTD